MKKAGILAIFIILAAATVLLGQSRLSRKQNSNITQTAARNEAVDYSGQVLQTQPAGNAPKILLAGKVPVAGITSHHIPMAESFIHNFYTQLQLANPDVRDFVVAGPDHFGRCGSQAVTTKKDFLTPYGLLANDREVTEALLAAGLGEDNECFGKEHSIGVQTAFIKKYFPDARITPVLFSAPETPEQAAGLARILAQKYPGAVVICSTDFSHYQSVSAANGIDGRTEKQLKDMEVSGIKLEQIDSPASVNFAMAFAKYLQAKPEYLAHANSFDFSGNPDNTTSYFDVIFAK